MKFQDYVVVISESVLTQGYDHFSPSICEPGDRDVLRVLDGDLSPGGEEQVAKEWASGFLDGEKTLYLAYRVGDRNIIVCEIRGREVVEKIRINVK